MIVGILLALGGTQAADGSEERPWVETRFHRIHLRNGNFIDGRMVGNSTEEVILQVKGGRFEVRRDQVKYVELVTMKTLRPAPSLPEAPAKAEASEPRATEPERRVVELKPDLHVSSAIRAQVDILIADWKAARGSSPYQLAPRLQAIGPEAVGYACWLIMNRDEKTPVLDLVDAIAPTGHPDVLKALESLQKTGSAIEQVAVVNVLEHLKIPAARHLLYRFVGSPATEVWRAASEAVVKLHQKFIAREAPEALLQLIQKASEKTPYAVTLARIGTPECRTGLLEYVKFADAVGRRAAMQGLVLFERREDAEIARAYLNDRSPELRRDACEFIGRLKGITLVPALIDLLSDPDRGVAATALWALRNISDQKYEAAPEFWKRWWSVEGERRAQALKR